MMTANHFCRNSLLWTALALLFSAAACTASAQVIPAFSSIGNISAFGTFTAVKPDFGYYGDVAVYGITVGGYVQTRHVVGVEVRGLLMRSGGIEHEEAALAGPRVAMHFGNFTPYVSVLGGVANAWRWSNPPNTGEPPPRMLGGFGPQWSVLGGLDVRLNHRFVLRMGELSYAKTYVKAWALTPLTASAGIVYRLN
jgi:hypothetical protein